MNTHNTMIRGDIMLEELKLYIHKLRGKHNLITRITSRSGTIITKRCTYKGCNHSTVNRTRRSVSTIKQVQLIVYQVMERHEITGRDTLKRTLVDGTVAEGTRDHLNNTTKHHHFVMEVTVEGMMIDEEFVIANRGNEFRSDSC